MTLDEYNKLFHKLELNRVAFKHLFECSDEVLRLVNAALEDKREACEKVCDAMATNPDRSQEATKIASTRHASMEQIMTQHQNIPTSITLRQWYAGLAMSALIARNGTGAFNFETCKDDPWRVALWAFDVADQMIRVNNDASPL